MINETLRKNINVDKPNLIPIFNLKEDDDAILKLSLFKNSTEFDITGQTVRLGAKTKNGLLEQIDGFTISKNNLDIELKNSILVAGKIEIDLEIKDTNGVMTTASFFILVNQKVLNDVAVEATNEFDTFTKTVDKIESDYTGLRRIIIDENQAASLQDQINNVNSSLDNMANDINNIANITKDKKLLISAFNGKNKETLDLYLSTDGKELTPINNHVLFDGQVRDPFTIYKDGYFYCAYTRNSSNGFGISRTKDLIEWEHFYINTTGYTKCWAPELFEFDGRVYVILSLQANNQVENDIYNQSIPFFKRYYSEINLNTMSIGPMTEITFSRDSNKIDSTMIVKNGDIYCFVKNEYSKEMEVYTSSALNSQFTYQYTIDYPLDVEGASVSYDGEKYHLILDCFMDKYTIHSESLDLVNWGTFEVVGNGKVRIQHPSQLILTDEIKEKINKYYSQRLAVEVSNTIKNDTTTISITKASKVIKDGVLKVDVEDSVIYVQGGENFNVNRIDSKVNRFYITVQAPMGNSANITFINGNNIFTPNNRNLDINTYTGYNEGLLEVKRVGNNYRFLANDYLGCNSPAINLTSLAVNGVIDNLELENNAFYFVEGVNQVAINNTSFKNDSGVNPFKCYFTLYSASPSCKLTIKNSGKIATPLAKDFVLTGDVHGDCTYQFGRVTVSPNQAPLRRIC